MVGLDMNAFYCTVTVPGVGAAARRRAALATSGRHIDGGEAVGADVCSECTNARASASASAGSGECRYSIRKQGQCREGAWRCNRQAGAGVMTDWNVTMVVVVLRWQ